MLDFFELASEKPSNFSIAVVSYGLGSIFGTGFSSLGDSIGSNFMTGSSIGSNFITGS